MNTPKSPDQNVEHQSFLQRMLSNIIESVRKFVKKIYVPPVSLDPEDRVGAKILKRLIIAGYQNDVLETQIIARNAFYAKEKRNSEIALRQKYEQQKLIKEEKIEQYKGILPEGAEIETRKLSFTDDIYVRNVDLAVKNGKIIKILHDENSLISKGTLSEQDNINQMKPFQKIGIIEEISNYDKKENVEYLSKVIFSVEKLNNALEKDEISIELTEDDAVVSVG